MADSSKATPAWVTSIVPRGHDTSRGARKCSLNDWSDGGDDRAQTLQTRCWQLISLGLDHQYFRLCRTHSLSHHSALWSYHKSSQMKEWM